MRRLGCAAVAVLLIVGCSSSGDDDDGDLEIRSSTTVSDDGWLEQFEPFTEVVERDGHTIGVKSDEGNIYTQDCDLAEELTSEGDEFGPSERDPVTQEYEAGYGHVCDR